jgi:hypothetical protein
VTFTSDRPEVEKVDRTDSGAPFNGKAAAGVTFAEPEEYILHVTANAYSGEGGAGFQCCWTNGQLSRPIHCAFWPCEHSPWHLFFSFVLSSTPR